MNCLQCNAPLIENARFCRICGQPVSTSSPNNVPGYPVQSNPTPNDSPTVATGWEPAPPPQPSQQAQWQPQYGEYAAPPAQPTQPAPQPQYAQQPLVISSGSMQSAGAQQGQYP